MSEAVGAAGVARVAAVAGAAGAPVGAADLADAAGAGVGAAALADAAGVWAGAVGLAGLFGAAATDAARPAEPDLAAGAGAAGAVPAWAWAAAWAMCEENDTSSVVAASGLAAPSAGPAKAGLLVTLTAALLRIMTPFDVEFCFLPAGKRRAIVRTLREFIRVFLITARLRESQTLGLALEQGFQAFLFLATLC